MGIMFAFRIIENTDAIISLLKVNNFYTPINSILRSTLEAIVDLDNLVNIDGYLEYLNYLICQFYD
ncbi:hypothetical protein [Paraclostridium sordellii]|uniref:hypothetical protein n=2 Tax=Paraclostridium sordellii TaxID=1505 RepID=UPI0022E5870A|nr:hypothetical protein [Paeniclostridium sordellii]